MKLSANILPVLLISAFLFTGCYTKFNFTSSEKQDKTVHIEEGLFVIDGYGFYIDYNTRFWFNHYGIDLANGRNLMRMAQFRYYYPSSRFFYSPYRHSFFSNYPGYANNFFFRSGGLIPLDYSFIVFGQPFFTDPYRHSFYNNRWGWGFGHSNYNNYFVNTSAVRASGSSPSIRRTGLSGGGVDNESRNRTRHVNNTFVGRGESLATTSIRYQINLPSAERVVVNERQQNLRERRYAQYQRSFERDQFMRPPLVGWYTYDNRLDYNSAAQNRNSTHNRARTNATRSQSTFYRAGTMRSTGNSSFRGTSNRGNTSSSAARPSGNSRPSSQGSSSRGSS